MHILLIHQAFTKLDEPGGTRHHEFARFLADRGHKITIIASPVSYLTGENISEKQFEEEKGGGVRIFRTYTYSALHKSFFHRVISFLSFMVSSFFRSISIKNVDLVWGTSPPIFQAFTAWLVSAIKRKPFLLEIRDLWPAFAVEVGVLKNKTIIGMSRWLERFLYKHADHIVVNSPGFFEHVREKGGKNISLIPNGSDTSLFQDIDTEMVRNEKGWQDAFIVLYAGAHGISNDLGVVVRAAEILDGIKNIRFVLLGDGKEKPRLVELGDKLNLNNLEFHEPVSKKRAAGLIAAADACIAILKPIEMYKTTYPNKVFDYMAAGKPIVLAIDGEIREVVEKAECGIFTPPGDPQTMSETVKKFYEDPLLAEKMGKNGRNYLKEHFDRKKIAADFADMIKEMDN